MQPFLTLNFGIALIGIFPSPDLSRGARSHGTTLRRRDQDVRRQLRARRLDVLRRPAPADLRERDALRAHRHDVRRRRRVDVRAAGPARPGPDPPGQRLHPRRDRRRRGGHPDRQPDRRTHAPAARDDRGREPVLAGQQRARPVDGRRPLHRGHRRRPRSRTSAISPTGGSQPHTNFQPYLVRSTTSSRCSASSPDSPKEPAMATRSSPRSGSSRSTSRPRAGRGATASSCRCRRTPRCSRCSARRTAATASPTSRCPTSRAGPRCTPARGRG